MSLFEKFNRYDEMRSYFEERGTMPFGAVTERSLSSTEAIVNGHRVILAGHSQLFR